MDFTVSDEQRMMAGALRSLLADICAPAQLRAVFEGRDAAAQERWQRLIEMGLAGAMAAEVHGGLGLNDGDFVLLAEEVGRAALPEPLIEHAAIAVPLLGELAQVPAVAALLPRAVSGDSRIAIAHPLNPCTLVPPQVTHWLLCDADGLYLCDNDAVVSEPQASIDAGRQLCRVRAIPTVARRIAAGELAGALAEHAARRGALYTAAQCLGLTERMLELAVAYAKEREQFGKPIGAYQAIKHQLASVAVKLEFARPVVWAAAAVVGHNTAAAQAAVAHARIAAADAADLAARTAIQVHGAMGYSWEVDLHFYMKRAWALCGAWGDRGRHVTRLAALLNEGAFALEPDQTFQ